MCVNQPGERMLLSWQTDKTAKTLNVVWWVESWSVDGVCLIETEMLEVSVEVNVSCFSGRCRCGDEEMLVMSQVTFHSTDSDVVV